MQSLKEIYEARWKGERGVVENIEDHSNSLVQRYDYANTYNHNAICLDVGCGSGFGCEILAKKAITVYGMDYSEEAIEFAKKHHSKKHIHYFVSKIPPIFWKDKTFDLVVAHEFLEHVENDLLLLEEIRRVMTDDGVFIMTTPWVNPKGLPKWHIREYTREQLDTLLKKVFSLVEIEDFNLEKHMAVCRK